MSGKNIFQDYIDNIQQAEFNISHTVESIFDTPRAKIVFFDTRGEIGVFTEIMGITKEGERAVQEMKIRLGNNVCV